jgi:hypothetical protein
MKKIKTTLNEFLATSDTHPDLELLIEMAKINRDEIPYDVCVFGGSSYGGGRQEHGQPHFHYADNIKTPDKFKLAVIIPTIEEWQERQELFIIPNESTHPTWDGLAKEKKIVLDWLAKPNVRFPRNSNLYVIINSWNTLNEDNKNVSQVPNTGEDLF